jgi:hypothetical protein
MVQKVKINIINQNANNPRIIKDTKFEKLVTSIKEFPQMLQIRPIVVDENNVVLGGNMRLRACKEAGLKEVWIEKVENLTEEQKDEFIIKDNVGFGEWEWDILANKWDEVQLKEWGMDVWQPTEENYGDFFEDKDEEISDIQKIVLEYTQDEYAIIIDKLAEIGGTKENAIYNLLTK